MVKLKASEILTRKVLTIDSNATLSEAIGKMLENNIHTLPVMEGKKYMGMVSYREILRKKSLNTLSKIQNFSLRTPGVSEETAVEDVIKNLKDSGLHAIPVLKNDSLVGIISRTDVIRRIDDIIDASAVKCREIMSPDPIFVELGEDISHAQQKFRSLDVTAMPVADKDGKLEGILKFADLSPEFLEKKERMKPGQYEGRRSPVAIKAESMMSLPVSVSESDTLSECCKKMISSKLHVIPVVGRNQKLIGVIENVDIIDLIVGRYSEGGLLVNVSGLDQSEEALYDATFFLGEKFAQRFARLTGHKNGTLSIHVIKYGSEGEIKYSLRTRLQSGNISMAEDSHDWNYPKCLSEILDLYEKRLKKSLGKD